MRELFELLHRWESIILITARDLGIETDSIKPISLVGVREGSVVADLLAPDELVPATKLLRSAMRTGDFSQLPKKTYGEFRFLQDTAAKHRWSFYLGATKGGPVLTANTTIPEPPEASELIEGETVVYAEIIQVGGTRPTARLKLEGQASPVTAHIISEKPTETAKALGRRLYDSVGLRGKATWDAQTGKIEEFDIYDVIEFEEKPINVGFLELARASGATWDEVDASKFVRSLRGRR